MLCATCEVKNKLLDKKEYVHACEIYVTERK
jgi:hypothetical protein